MMCSVLTLTCVDLLHRIATHLSGCKPFPGFPSTPVPYVIVGDEGFPIKPYQDKNNNEYISSVGFAMQAVAPLCPTLICISLLDEFLSSDIDLRR